MKPALLLGMVTGWLGLLMTLAMPSVAQTPPLYVACVTTTPSSSPPPTITPRPTSTTIRLASTTPTASPTITLTPFPTYLNYITPVDPRNGPQQTASIFGEATRMAEFMTAQPGYNPSTAIAQTAEAFYTTYPLSSPTIDELSPTPTIAQARYRVDSIAGVNVRSAPSLSAGIVSSLRQGDVVIVTEMSQYIDGWVWGRVTGGWVAMRSASGVNLLRAVP